MASSDLLMKTAAVLDALADDVDAREAAARTQKQQALDAKLAALEEKFVAATGEAPPADVLAKIASADESVFQSVQALVEKTAFTDGRVGIGGAPGARTADRVPRSRKEALEVVKDAWGAALLK